MTPVIESRLPGAQTNIFTVMSRLANEHGAINLSQGFPDFPVDQELTSRVYRAMEQGHNQYAPMAGVPLLRERIAHLIAAEYARPIDPESEVTVTAGGTQALYIAIAALLRPGDEAIVFDPAFDTYDPAIRLNGGVPVHVPMHPPDFTIPWDRVEAIISPRTRMIIVNTPHNPCGTVLSENDIVELERLCVRYGLLVIGDEVYERMVFDGLRHHSVLSRPALTDHAVAVFSFGKTFHVTGWKTGYVVAAPRLMEEIRKIHQYLVFSVNTPIQVALADFLQDPGHYLHLGELYQQKRDRFLKLLERSPFRPLPCSGSYFQLVSYDGYTTESDRDLAVRLTREKGLASIPVSAFYQDGTDHHLLRFCFAKRPETLDAAGVILAGL